MSQEDFENSVENKALLRAAKRYADASVSKRTLKSYSSDWVDFEFWCKRRKRKTLPASPESIGMYLTEMATQLKASSLRRRIAAISKAHTAEGMDSPTHDPYVKAVLKGILNEIGTAQKHAAPTLTGHIQKIIAALPDGPKGIRDKALLLLGFAGGFRRSEIVALDVEDLAIGEEGIVVTVRKSKTDQQGKGRKVGIAFGSNCNTCPIKALEAWLTTSGTTSGAVFRPIDQWGYIAPTRLTDWSVRYILKECLSLAGINSRNFSGHSLRAGFATVARMNGAEESEIQRTTGHVSLEVLRRYIRDGDLFRKNASKKLGL